MKQRAEYKRLPGRGYAYFGFGRSSLWLGPDHLLLIIRRGYTEEYKRFYYRDIRAIVIRRTQKYLAWNVILGSLTALCLLVLTLGMVSWEWSEPGLIAWSIFTGIFLFFLTLHLAKGPTCATHLYTAVHAEPLASMNRLSKSLRVMRQIGPNIETVQGAIDHEQLLSREAVGAPPIFRRPVQVTPAETVSNYSGIVHVILFAVFLIDSAQSSLSIFHRTNLLHTTNLIVFFALWAGCIAALILQRRSRLTSTIKGLTWGSFCFLALMLLLGYIYSMIVLFDNPAAARTQWDLTKAVWNASPLESPVLMAINIFGILGSAALGLSGLIAWMRFKRMPTMVQPAEIQAGGAE